MALTTGSRLGPYEIGAPIGAGGMGEVYQATDTRLSRTVAIKVLPPHWAQNAEMKQRFEREARTIASLSDPHICALHDIGHEGGIDFLVMEYLEGETLADRIARGPIGLDEALTIAIAIASALDQAHRRGIVHRDLKPSNVMLTATGAKLLDFGLAKGAPVTAPGSRDLSAPGVVLGTLHYMSPEQLEGAEADASSDLFALGVIIREMLTGKKVFDARSRVLLMSAIATHEPPPLSAIDSSIPAELDHVVATCLAKDPADRWQSARDVIAELEAVAQGDGDDASIGASVPTASSRSLGNRALVAGALIAAMAVSVPGLLYLRGEAAEKELRFRVPIQVTAQPAVTIIAAVAAGALFSLPSFAVSPDGKSLAFAARQNTSDSYTIYVRPIGGIAPRALITAADGAPYVFWSPDGQWLGFVAAGRLKKIAASGGSAQDLAAVTDFRGGSWNPDGVILLGSTKGLMRVAAEGGTPESVTSLDGGETSHSWPHFLPDGRHFLYTASSNDEKQRAIYAGELGSKDRVRVLDIDSNAIYSDTGHLIFHRSKAVFAQRFDPKSLKLSGEPSRIADEVSVDSGSGRGFFAASRTGVLAYFENPASAGGNGTPQSDSAEWHLAWATRTGAIASQPGPIGVFRGVEVSPDGSRIAVHRHDGAGGDIWIVEPSGSETRLTFDSNQDNCSPIWSPDGRDIVFVSTRNGKPGLYRKQSNGSSAEELLFESELSKAPLSWSPDGKSIVFSVRDPKTKSDLWMLSLADKKAVPLLNTPFEETHAQISPDGQWLAYTSDSVGNRREIHVQPFPSGAGHWQISDKGGDWPRWRRDGHELYYHSIGNIANPSVPPNLAFVGPIYSVAVNSAGGSFEHRPPSAVLNLRAINQPHSGGDYHTWALSPDGQQFLYYQFVVASAGTSASAENPDHPSGLMIAMNWQRTLKK